METYFDILPREINEIILLNVTDITDYENLYESKLFNEILFDEKFWIKNIKFWCTEIDFNSIPQSLLDFDVKIFDIILMNYGSIFRSYTSTMSRLEHHDDLVRSRRAAVMSGSLDPKLSSEIIPQWHLSINNFKLLRLDLLSKKDRLKIRNIFDIINPDDSQDRKESNIIGISFKDTDEYSFIIIGEGNTIRYKVFRQDVIAMIMHLECNEALMIDYYD